MTTLDAEQEKFLKAMLKRKQQKNTKTLILVQKKSRNINISIKNQDKPSLN